LFLHWVMQRIGGGLRKAGADRRRQGCAQRPPGTVDRRIAQGIS
jgi:hypothetical protein